MTYCKAKTKEGKKCTRKVAAGAYCWQHGAARSYVNKKSPSKKLTGADYQQQKKYCHCVMDVKRKGTARNPWSICSKSVGRVHNSCKEFE